MDYLFLSVVAVLMLAVFILQYRLSKRLVQQNNTLLTNADHRLDRANEMVLTLAHSADELSKSVSELKDMMVHLEDEFNSRNAFLIKNRDEFRDAYTKLLRVYEEQQHKYESVMQESYNTLKELAKRPTINNNNNLNEES